MIRQKVAMVQEKIRLACVRAQRQPREITLIAVTKGRSIEEVQEVTQAGVTDIGENKIQEARQHYAQCHHLMRLRWHMIGHLQTNKVDDCVKMFDLIHSVDSVHLASEIDKEASKIQKIQEVLIQVNISAEETKYGFAPQAVGEALKEIEMLKNVSVNGLMAIAPMVDTPQKVRPYFRDLRQLRDSLSQKSVHKLSILSMGMSGDFESAILEGATMVRLGRAIFEG